jgi:arylsulfatase A-like enzyme
VWLTTEDNSANWYRLYNPEHGVAMPNVEKLAKNGLVFNNAYSCGPVCSVARSTIISGCYGPRTGAQYHRQQVPAAMPAGVKMFPYYLRQAGYYTTNNSKQDYNYLPSDRDGVWDLSSRKASFRDREPGQPFFHVQNFTRTHESKLFGDLPAGQEYVVAPADVELFPYHPDTPLFRQKYAQYLTLNQMVDNEMGSIIQQLEEDGLMDDTFIFHYGDHGGVLPGSKGYAHNDGLQVAMVVYVPENWKHLVPALRGSRVDGIVEFVDLSATVLNLAGVEIPGGIDGKPFLGKGVSLKQLNQRDTAFGYAERFDEKYDMVRFLRKGRYSYWRNYQPFNFDGLHNFYRYKQPAFCEWRDLAEAGKLNDAQAAFFKARPPEQLFDLEKDPHEINNLANDPAYSDVLIELRRAMRTRVKGLPDTGFFPESVVLKEGKGSGTAFGQKNKAQIEKLVDIADLQLRPMPESAQQIAKALQSPVAAERYWGLITCSAFGKQALSFAGQIEKIAAEDPDRLVRVRAAEFLGLTHTGDPAPILFDVLKDCTDPVEVNLILNSAVLLCDSAGVQFEMSKAAGAAWTKLGGLVPHRVNYLRGGTGDVPKKRKTKN